MYKFAAFAAAVLCLHAASHALEWDATSYSAGGGLGYALPVSENTSSGFQFLLYGGMSVPLVVEHHLRLSPKLSFHYLPLEASKEENAVGGNYLSGNLSVYLEHDFAAGTHMGWYGLGPQLSINASAGQYQWQSSGSDVEAVAIDETFALSAALAARIGLTVADQYEFWLTGQISPLSNAYNSLSLNLAYRF